LIKNTFNPEAPGTIIKQEIEPVKSKAIKGISSINDTSLITITGLGMVGVIGVNFRIFKALAQNGISVFMVSTMKNYYICNQGKERQTSKNTDFKFSAYFGRI
jgi:aspartokinase